MHFWTIAVKNRCSTAKHCEKCTFWQLRSSCGEDIAQSILVDCPVLLIAQSISLAIEGAASLQLTALPTVNNCLYPPVSQLASSSSTIMYFFSLFPQSSWTTSSLCQQTYRPRQPLRPPDSFSRFCGTPGWCHQHQFVFTPALIWSTSLSDSKTLQKHFSGLSDLTWRCR